MTGITNSFTVTAKVEKIIAIKGNHAMFECTEEGENGLRLGVVSQKPDFKLRVGASLVLQGVLTLEEDGSLTLAATSLAELFTNELREILNQSFKERQTPSVSEIPKNTTPAPTPETSSTTPVAPSRPEETPQKPVVEATPPSQNEIAPETTSPVVSKTHESVIESPDMVVTEEAPPLNEDLGAPPPSDDGYAANLFNFNPNQVEHRFEGNGGSEFKKV